MAVEGEFSPPEKSRGDVVHAGISSALGTIPYLGAAAAEVFNWVVVPPVERRLSGWRETIGAKLEELANDERVDVQELVDNEVFTTTLLHATQAAIRNHHEEKITALRNAVINATQPNPPDESKQQVFIDLVDRFTVWHLRILKFFQDPPGWFVTQGREVSKYAFSSSLSQILHDAYPELGDEEQMLGIIMNDLTTAGLFSGGGLSTMMSAGGAYEKRTTGLGNEFLAFISDPELPGSANRRSDAFSICAA